MKVLFFGDVYAEAGRTFLFEKLDELKSKYKPNLVLLNGENICNNGRGINRDIYKDLMKRGISAITMGNWVFANHELFDFIDDSNIIRPANYINAPGKGYLVLNFNNKKILIISVQGLVYMTNNYLENPFVTVERIISSVEHDYTIIDIHGEATSEKIAIGHHFDGRATAVLGTHTHVQTADERVLPKGTLYISDVGMTGPKDGIIGVERSIVINRFLGEHVKSNSPAPGKRQINAVFMDFDKKVIERINIYE